MLTVLDADAWRARRAAHERRVEAWTGAHLTRRRHGRAHPVEDFLFTYYSYRPKQLKTWRPAAGEVLADARPADLDALGPGYHANDAGVTFDVDAYLARRGDSVAWIARLLAATSSRPGQFGCFGMHEWAMVYGQGAEEVRHAAWPLRLSPTATKAVVDANRVRCSHFDAFRFFTPEARPLNVLQPTRESQPDLEQPGCLHATMDLYKWAYKCAPLAGADLVADCFELARDVRELDMRASPYDLEKLGYQPVRVETPEGRAEYAAAQREFARRAAPLRARLLDALTPAGRVATESGRAATGC